MGDNDVDTTEERVKSKHKIAAVTLPKATMGYRRPLVLKDNPLSPGTEEGESASFSEVELYYNVLWYVLNITLLSFLHVYPRWNWGLWKILSS